MTVHYFLKCDSHWFTTEHINFEMCTMKLLRVYAIPDNILRFIYYGPISLMCMLRHDDKDKDKDKDKDIREK